MGSLVQSGSLSDFSFKGFSRGATIGRSNVTSSKQGTTNPYFYPTAEKLNIPLIGRMNSLDVYFFEKVIKHEKVKNL